MFLPLDVNRNSERIPRGFFNMFIVLQTACSARGSEPNLAQTSRSFVFTPFWGKSKPPVSRVLVDPDKCCNRIGQVNKSKKFGNDSPKQG